MPQPDPVAAILQDCWNEALDAFATAHIFEARARALRRWLRGLTFLGIAVPVAVGSVILSFGVHDRSLPWVLWLAGILGLAQIVASVWSLASKWDDGYAYALESAAANHRLSNGFRDLARDPPAALEHLRTRFHLLKTDNACRADLDYKAGITEQEKRRGYCAGLWRFRRACACCGKVPESPKPSDCWTCGQF